MAILSEEDLTLLGEPQLAHVATIEADGTRTSPRSGSTPTASTSCSTRPRAGRST
ncbi:hypothetical protein V2I01_16640 [Micromonospora sp. BRA006-A]|nr:hypothetical protein [Micromonospora sp. BRA006-A]